MAWAPIHSLGLAGVHIAPEPAERSVEVMEVWHLGLAVGDEIATMRDAHYEDHRIQARSYKALTEAGEFKTWVPRVCVAWEDRGEEHISSSYYTGGKAFLTQEDADKYAPAMGVKWIENGKPQLPKGDWQPAETEEADG